MKQVCGYHDSEDVSLRCTSMCTPTHSHVHTHSLIQMCIPTLTDPSRVQELCESRGCRPGLSVLMSLTVSVDVKQHWTVLRHWSQFVPNMSTPDIWGYEALLRHHYRSTHYPICMCTPTHIFTHTHSYIPSNANIHLHVRTHTLECVHTHPCVHSPTPTCAHPPTMCTSTHAQCVYQPLIHPLMHKHRSRTVMK